MNSKLCDASRSTLLVIDFQQRLIPVIHDGDAIANNATALAQAAKVLDIPVIGTAQNTAGLGPNLPAIHQLCDRMIEKQDFGACAEPAFLPSLDKARNELVVTGCEAHVCVLQTVLGLLEQGWQVRLVVDAIGSRQPLSKSVAVDRAKAAGAQPVTAEMVMFEWLRTSRHPRFKEVLALIKNLQN